MNNAILTQADLDVAFEEMSMLVDPAPDAYLAISQDYYQDGDRFFSALIMRRLDPDRSIVGNGRTLDAAVKHLARRAAEQREKDLLKVVDRET